MGSEERLVVSTPRARPTISKRRVTRAMLSRLKLFDQADIESIEGLLADCPIRELVEGQVLISAGDRAHAMYMVLAGRLRLRLPDGDAVLIEAGKTFGELPLLEQKPVGGTVAADTLTQLLALDEARLWALVRASHAFAGNFLGAVGAQLRGTPVHTGARGEPGYRRNATLDVLTGLHNRRGFEELLRRQIMRSSMNQQPLAVLLVDIDHFKRFNEEFGYAAGDQALHAIGQTLVNNVRPTDLVARYGGQQFAVMLPDADALGAQAVAARARSAVAEAVVMMADESILPPLTVSIGMACLQQFATADEVLAKARGALETAHAEGHNRVAS